LKGTVTIQRTARRVVVIVADVMEDGREAGHIQDFDHAAMHVGEALLVPFVVLAERPQGKFVLPGRNARFTPHLRRACFIF